jgi:hypothetical protein
VNGEQDKVEGNQGDDDGDGKDNEAEAGKDDEDMETPMMTLPLCVCVYSRVFQHSTRNPSPPNIQTL